MNACAAINREKAAPKARLSRDVVAAVFLVGGVVAALRYGAGDFVAVLLVLVASAYFLPTIIAAIRKHNNTAAILLLNLFVGWTFLGWVAALIWASTDNVRAAAKD
jgi:hypothetical protein